MTQFLELDITSDDNGRRLDRFLSSYFDDLTQGDIQRLLRSKMIRLDGIKAKSDTRINTGSILRYPNFLKIKTNVSRETITFPNDIILYQDNDLMVINKPWGLASQGGSRMKIHLDMMLESLPKRNGYRPSTVHRLDKDTSGCLLIAKKRSIAAELGAALRNREFEKYYLALTDSIPSNNSGTIESYLIKSSDKNKRDLMQSLPNEIKGSQYAQSAYYVLASNHGKALLLMTPITGRTHQLRVHSRDIKAPIIGDPKYNPSENKQTKLCLHAAKLIFSHPKTQDKVEINAPLPEHFTKIMRKYELSLNNPVSYENREILKEIIKYSKEPYGFFT